MKLISSKWLLPTKITASALTLCTIILLFGKSAYAYSSMILLALSLLAHSMSRQKNESSKIANIRYSSFISAFFLLISSVVLMSAVLIWSDYKSIPTYLLLFLTVIFLLIFNFIFYVRLTISNNKREIATTRLVFILYGLTSIFLISWIMLESIAF